MTLITRAQATFLWNYTNCEVSAFFNGKWNNLEGYIYIEDVPAGAVFCQPEVTTCPLVEDIEDTMSTC